MSIYIVGDLQGCLKPLRCLLDRVQFDPVRDELWSVGDIVNRGPESLATLRFLKSLGSQFHMVLGNHDLHLLAVAYGCKEQKKGDTLSDILSAPDRESLLDWLRHQPLLYHRSQSVLVHAGIPPQWSFNEAASFAAEVEQILQSDRIADFLGAMYGNTPDRWEPGLQGMTRLRTITNYLTRMRICRHDGTLDLSYKAGPESLPAGFSAWFDLRDAREPDVQFFFGHWAALPAKTYHGHFHALDSGCIWGKQLTLFDSDRGVRYGCDCG